MACSLSVLALLVAGAILFALTGCDSRNHPTPPEPPAEKIRWQGEDTGYQCDEATDRSAGRRFGR